ncbi:glutathione S-transferase omega-1-like [Manis pentadactyla]|uniref:glutathione S-transferase omega-1-like n=1 Tax=Manis pentadactyla TaxID=143292 RepID=UPI00255C59EF|nr:glutathione S-transferase omega-1-like [Manis pentadactyla]
MSRGSAWSLAKGSAPPGPVPEGLIRLCGMRFCPFAERTLLVLKAKGTRHEVININLKDKPEWFFKKNPSGLVPVLENSQGHLIYESTITYTVFGKLLWPERRVQQARGGSDQKKTTFFGGSSLSMTDYLIWPWFEWLEALELNKCVDHTPKLKLWMAAMKEDPTVSALLTDGKALQGFLDLYLQNSPQACDCGL